MDSAEFVPFVVVVVGTEKIRATTLAPFCSWQSVRSPWPDVFAGSSKPATWHTVKCSDLACRRFVSDRINKTNNLLLSCLSVARVCYCFCPRLGPLLCITLWHWHVNCEAGRAGGGQFSLLHHGIFRGKVGSWEGEEMGAMSRMLLLLLLSGHFGAETRFVRARLGQTKRDRMIIIINECILSRCGLSARSHPSIWEAAVVGYGLEMVLEMELQWNVRWPLRDQNSNWKNS